MAGLGLIIIAIGITTAIMFSIKRKKVEDDRINKYNEEWEASQKNLS